MGVADRLLLDVANRRRLGADLTRAVVSVERTGSMESKPGVVVVVDDPRDEIMQSSVLTRPAMRAIGTAEASTLRPIDVLLDGVWYRLQQARREDDGVTLTFDHRGAVYMTHHDSPISASRSNTTRALFIRRQVDEVGKRRGRGHRLAFWAWEVRKRMPLAAGSAETSSRSESDRDVSDTAGSKAKDAVGVTVKGVKANAEQRRNMAIGASVAADLNAPPRAVLALFVAGIGESNFRHVPNEGGSPYTGVWQSHRKYNHSVAEQARLFLLGGQGFQSGGAIKASRQNPGWTPGTIATKVEASGKPGSFYDVHRKEAEQAIEALGGIAIRGSAGGGTGGSYVKPYRFKRARGENAWANTGKLAEEVNRRRFITIPRHASDLFVYAADEDLLRLRSQAVIVPDATYVSEFSYDLDYGKTARAARLVVSGDAFEQDFAWGLPVMLREAGPASGKWLVWDVRETDGETDVELELRQPQHPKLEPASEVVQRQSDGSMSDLPSIEGKLSGTPKAIIDRYVIPLARKHEMRTGNTVAKVEAANGAHSQMTTTGNVSHHKGPPSRAWAADMSNGTSPTRQMDALANDIAAMFGLKRLDMSTSGARGSTQMSEGTRDGYRMQLIYRSTTGGNHDNHVHFGLARGAGGGA
jgi:hypothetical protein